MLRVTDVLPTAFSVVWVANQAASCSANVYADPNGQTPITGLTIISESANHPPAKQYGVMKVRVSGLATATTYYFQIVTTSAEGIFVEPSSGPLPSVKTEVSSVFVENDVLRHRILMSDGSTPALGTLLLVDVEGGDYPVTGWVGDGISAPWARVELNNVYSKTNHMSLELSGGEAITLESIGGFMGFQRLLGTVPAEIPGQPGLIQEISPLPSDNQCTLWIGRRPRGLRIERR
jgi:hypothetical protein